MKKTLALPAILLLFFAAAEAREPRKAEAVTPARLAALAPQGAKNPLPGGGWFTWKFSEKPKLGTLIMKVQVFGKEGGQEKTMELTGESGMPSMPYHNSGPVKFKLNKKGDYLLPVDVVMPGEWEIVVRVKKGKKEIYAGKIVFSV